ncbi:MAG: hypothetical protein ACRDGD_08000 [Candidatus Limnocylindria bacterium]
MRIPRQGFKASAIGAAIAILLTACAAGSGSGAGDDDGDLALSIASPADGAEVSVPFDVQLDASVALGTPDTGNHHVHFYFDTDISSAEYEMVFDDAAQVARELAPGEHTIIASLRNADHSDAGPSQEITVVVGDSETDDAEPEPSSAPTEADFYDY